MVSLRKLVRTGHVSTLAIDVRQLAGVTEDESSFSLFRSKPNYLTALYSAFYTSVSEVASDNSQEKLSKYHPSRYVGVALAILRAIGVLYFIQKCIGYTSDDAGFMDVESIMHIFL